MLKNQKHNAVLDEYYKNGFKKAEAYMAVYQDCTYQAAAVCMNRLLNDDKIIEEMEQRDFALQNAQLISMEEILTDLIEIKNVNKDNNPNTALKALDQISKLLGFNAPTKTETTIKEQPLFGPDDELKI